MKKNTRTIIRRYSDILQLPTFDERLKYLRLSSKVGIDTFGFDRYINQRFYSSREWKNIRSYVIVRDNGCDLGVKDLPIVGRIYIHHLNPISLDDIYDATEYLLQPEYLICCSFDTHNAIHYGIMEPNRSLPVERSPFDMCPWRTGKKEGDQNERQYINFN